MRRLLSLLLCLVLALSLAGCTGGGKEVIVWDDLALGPQLPEPGYLVGTVYSDTDNYLNMTLYRTDGAAFRDYVRACEDMGYTVEKEKTDWDFRAFNQTGYELIVWHHDKELEITLRAPVALYPLTWPTSALGRMLPVPEASSRGQVVYETVDYLELFIGDMDPQTYSAYVTACIEAGFDVDYTRGDDYFYGDHAAGYELSVSYEGFGVMRIYLTTAS